MLYVFGFETIGVVISDLYFLDPEPEPGQGEGPERGVRLEIRFLEQGAVDGSVYASRPITIGRPLWRGDLLESVDGPVGSFDRTHHHLAFRGWEPGRRMYDKSLSANPIEFLRNALSEPRSLLSQSEFDPEQIAERDFDELRSVVPEIIAAVERLLERVRAGELAQAPSGSYAEARVGWL